MKTETAERSDEREVLELLGDYYEGLYRTDVTTLRRVFSPSARYATIAKGSLLELSIDDYLRRVQERTSPADEGVAHDYRVRSLCFAGENTALAELECSLFGHDYIDFLSLLRIDGRWRIQAKVFEGTPQITKEA